MLYGIKNVEIPEKAKDKARLVLMGNLRFTKSGKLLLDRWFRSPGEFWAPASSMAGLRFVACVAVILGLPLETIDLDAAYLQTEVKQQDDYLQLTPEIIEGLPDDWRAAVKKAIDKDIARKWVQEQGLDPYDASVPITVPADEMRLQRVYLIAPPGAEAARDERTDVRLWIEDTLNGERAYKDTVFNGKDN